jgi:hypothetical protein
MQNRLFAAAFTALLMLAAPARAGVLPIQPVVQETQVWCWLAVGEMIFKYLGIRNVNPAGIYQCGIIGALAADQYGMNHPCNVDCRNCVVPAGEEVWVRAMLERYPAVVQAVYGPAQQLVAGHDSRILSPDEVAAEIDAGLPMIAGVTPYGLPAGVSAHVALIIGYERGQDGALWLLVNDPYPYNFAGHNPYVAAGGQEQPGGGSYWISYDNFAYGLQWAETFRIRRQ